MSQHLCRGLDSLEVLVLSFYHVASGDQTWMVMIWQQAPLLAGPSSRSPKIAL